MSADQHYSLRWNNYQRHLVTAFDSLLSTQDFVDVTLGCEGKKLPAHKMLLSACSPYFKDLLKDNVCGHPIIVLRDVNYSDMKCLLQFIYNGEVNVLQEQLDSFLRTAESLQILGLTNSEAGHNSDKEVPDAVHNNGGSCSSPMNRKRSLQKNNVSYDLLQIDHKNSNLDFEKDKSHLPEKMAKLDDSSDDTNIKHELIELTDDETGDRECYEEGMDADSDLAGGGFYEEDHVKDNLVNGGQYNSSANQTIPVEGTPEFYDCAFADGRSGWQCSLCERTFSHIGSTKQHMAVHQGRTTCPVCAKVFNRVTDMKTHCKTTHKMLAI